MNREIKFRALDVKGNTMHDDGEAKYWLSQGFDETFPTEYDFMQYTGLNDKHGTEIYEGDIVDRTEYIGGNFLDERRESFVVEYRGTSFQFVPIEGKSYKQYTIQPHSDVLIIGNIHQHPHLLTPTK